MQISRPELTDALNKFKEHQTLLRNSATNQLCEIERKSKDELSEYESSPWWLRIFKKNPNSAICKLNTQRQHLLVVNEYIHAESRINWAWEYINIMNQYPNVDDFELNDWEVSYLKDYFNRTINIVERDRHLTEEEADKYDQVRKQVEEEFPRRDKI